MEGTTLLRPRGREEELLKPSSELENGGCDKVRGKLSLEKEREREQRRGRKQCNFSSLAWCRKSSQSP